MCLFKRVYKIDEKMFKVQLILDFGLFAIISIYTGIEMVE